MRFGMPVGKRCRRHSRRLSRASALLPASAVGIAVVVILAPSEGQATCTPTTSPLPPSGTVITCSGSTNNQNPPNGYGSSSLTGVTVNVGSAASVTGSAVGLQLGAGNIVNNAGAISGSSAGIAALDNSTIINSGQISATGASGTALSARGTITNTGTISGTSGISALGGASTQITNFGTITATGVGANAVLVGATTAILTITPTSVINGIVLMAGPQDTLQLGGSGSGAFNVGLIGSSQQYRGFESFRKVGDSAWTLTGTTAAVTPWTINQGTLSISSDTNLGATSSGLTFNGGTLQFLAGFTSNRTLTLNAGGGTLDTNGNIATLAGTIGGSGGLTKVGAGTLALSGSSSYSGTTLVSAGILQAGATNAFSASSAFMVGSGAKLDLASFNQTIGSLAGAGNMTLGSATLTTNGNNTSTTFSGVASGAGGLTKVGAGTLVFTGNNTYTGATTISGGALMLGNGGTSGSIAGNVVDNGILAINRSDTFTFGNLISGSERSCRRGPAPPYSPTTTPIPAPPA